MLLLRLCKVSMPQSYRDAICRSLMQAESMVGYLNFVGDSPFALMAHPEFWSSPDGPSTLVPGQADIEKLHDLAVAIEQVANHIAPLMVLVRLYQVDGVERTIANVGPRGRMSGPAPI